MGRNGILNLLMQDWFVVSDVQVCSISEEPKDQTEELQVESTQREIEVQVHSVESEGSADPPAVLAVSSVSAHDATVVPEGTNGAALGGENIVSQARSAGPRKSSRNKRVPHRFQASVEFFNNLKFSYFIKYVNGLRIDPCFAI